MLARTFVARNRDSTRIPPQPLSYILKENGGGSLVISVKKVYVIGLSVKAHQRITAADHCARGSDAENTAETRFCGQHYSRLLGARARLQHPVGLSNPVGRRAGIRVTERISKV